jgi:hypothetical protein
MKYTLISTHQRTMPDGAGTKQHTMGLYFSHDGSTGTPYFISRDADNEQIWISADTAAEMLCEEHACVASRVPPKLIMDLLDAAK